MSLNTMSLTIVGKKNSTLLPNYHKLLLRNNALTNYIAVYEDIEIH